MIEFLKSLPATLLDQILHPPFKPDPTLENTLIGLVALAVTLGGAWLWNRRH